MAQEKRDNREVVWCWVKKLPCNVECQMWSLEHKKCKLVIVCDLVLIAFKLMAQSKKSS